MEVDSLLSPRGPHTMNSDDKAWQQIPYPLSHSLYYIEKVLKIDYKKIKTRTSNGYHLCKSKLIN